MKWKIYYHDGSSYSDKDGFVQNAPGWGALIIAQEDQEPGNYNIGRRYLFGEDYFCWEGWGWTSRNITGREFYLAQPGWKKIVNGTVVLDEIFYKVKKAAEEDNYLPIRSVVNSEISDK